MKGIVALFAIARTKWLALTTWVLAGAAVAGGINMLLPVIYEATAKVVVAAPYWNDSTALMDPNMGGGKERAWGDEFTQQRMASYAGLVTTPLVANRVSERLGLGESGEELAKKLTAHIVADSVVLEVIADDASPVRAAMIADAAAQQTVSVIKELERPPFSQVSPIQPVFTDPAAVPSQPISPRTLLNIGCGAIVGLLLGLTWLAAHVGIREDLRLSRARGDDERDDEFADILGVLAPEDQLALDTVQTEAKLLRLEVAHRMRTAEVDSFVMTSPRATPATATIAGLLASALTDSGSPTIVVCADFAVAPSDSALGLGDVLCTATSLDSVIQSDEQRGINWIPAGTAPQNPTRELTGPKMRELLSDLACRYSHVIVVGPPILESADTVDVAGRVGASVLVETAPRTTAEELRESERLLGLSEAPCLGRVVVAEGDSKNQPEITHFNRRSIAA